MRRRSLLIILCYIITFAAGTTLGLVAGPPPRHERMPRWSLSSELNLTESQRAEIDGIWSDVTRPAMHEIVQKRRELSREKREAQLALLSPEQREQWDAIEAEYRAKFDQLNAQRKQAFEQARSRTREVLTPEQQKAWDELIARRAAFERGGREHRPARPPMPHDPPPPHDAP